MTAPRREDYRDVLEWARDFEAWTTGARSSSVVKIVGESLLAVCVCAPADMPLAEVEAEVSRIHPTGISTGWRLSKTGTFSDAPTNTVPCQRHAANIHYYMTC